MICYAMMLIEAFVFVLLFITKDLRADPCTSHKKINDIGNRGTRCRSWSSPPICDRNGFDPGWYVAFYNGEYIQMPEEIPNSYTCGTESPIWINGSHPNTNGSTKDVTGCVRGFLDGETCIETFPIQIKNCSGFYAYNLPYVNLCFCGYCFGNHTCEDKTTTRTSSRPKPSSTTTTIPPSDPCLHAMALPNLDRRGSRCSVTEHATSLCDRTLKSGWYKAIDDNMFHDMPTYCVSVGACGTEEPIWLNGSFPQFADGAVLRKACVRGVVPEDSCCKKMIDVYIRNCFTYNVYYLPYTELCYRAYCFGDRECETSIENSPTINVDKASKSLVFISLGCFAGVLFIMIGVAFMFIKTRRLKIGHSRVDLQKTPPPPYSLPTHSKPAVHCENMNGDIPLKS